MKKDFHDACIAAMLPAGAALAGEACDVTARKEAIVEALAKLASDFE